MDDVGLQEFYTGQCILLTGATGFLGKAVTEKLLRTCPNIKRLYLLIRTKKGKDSLERISDLFNDAIFEPMKEKNPDYESKVSLISGDVTLPDLGISESDRKIIMDEVTIVFHGAATVRFDEKLQTAVNINIRGTKQLLQLCSGCRNLKAFVHISTAYANCNKSEIEEVVYPPPAYGDDIINLAEKLPDDMLERCSPMIIYGWPNTYAFTKQIAEDLVRSEALSKQIPAAIFRPAIVIGSYREPIPGWIDNVYGPTGVTAAVGAGLMRTLHADNKSRADLVPVDMTVNAAFAVAWDVARKNRNGGSDDDCDKIPVYNFVTSKENPLNWGDYMEYNLSYGLKDPTIKSLWYYSLTMTKYLPLYYFYSFLLHIIPAILIDSVLVLTVQKPQALKIYRKVQKFSAAISYFSTKEWNFHNDNVVKLWEKLSEKDKELFLFDMNVVDWDLCFKNSITAIRVFLFHDTPDTLPAARRKILILWVLHRAVQVLFILLVTWLLWSPASTLLNWIISELSYLQKESVNITVNSGSYVAISKVR